MFIVKVPAVNEVGSKTEGCERTGNAILKALREIHSNEQGKPMDVNLLDLEEIHLDNKNLDLTNKLIYENSLEIFETKTKTIFLGGDHSISYSINKAFLNFCQKRRRESCLIVFDAHADCMKSDKEFPTSRGWVRKLIESGFSPKNIMIVGARNIQKEELSFLKENNVRVFGMNQIMQDIDDASDIIMEFSDGKDLYVSIDIDVIDPAFAPSTAYPESGGLTARQFLYIIQRINKIKNLKALDIVEINEKKDEKRVTVKLAAKILSELL